MHPIVAQVHELAAVNPGFRLTSFLEAIANLGKSFIDTPEERAAIKTGLMVVYDTLVTPRAPTIAVAARPFVEGFIDSTLAKLGG